MGKDVAESSPDIIGGAAVDSLDWSDLGFCFGVVESEY
jgi:hypothetical protein